MLVLPELPYARDALAPAMSQETLDYHYGKHHKAYVDKANGMIEGTAMASLPIDELVVKAWNDKNAGLFNNAAQAWNHDLFWDIMRKDGGGEPAGVLAVAITASFGSYDDFRTKFKTTAAGQFGSGWAWLVKKDDGSLDVYGTANGENPLVHGGTALMGLDVWEHAYYLDHRNDRPGYVDTFLDKLIDWEKVEARMG